MSLSAKSSFEHRAFEISCSRCTATDWPLAEVVLLLIGRTHVSFDKNQFDALRRDQSSSRLPALSNLLRRYDMNERSQKQGGKNWILPKEVIANWFFCDSHWLDICSNHFCPAMRPNGESVAMDSGQTMSLLTKTSFDPLRRINRRLDCQLCQIC